MIGYSSLRVVSPFPADASLGSGIDYLRVILSLAVCLALGIGVAYMLRRLHAHRPSGQPRQLRVLESIRLDTRTSLYLVQCGNQRKLVASGTHGLNVSSIETIDAAPVKGNGETPREA
jgi:flagellar biogenesis protein FliO